MKKMDMGMKFISAFTVIVLYMSLSFSIPVKISLGADLSDSEIKKSQMKQIETDLSREKEQFLKFDLKEKGLLDQLSDMEKDITEKRSILKKLSERIHHGKQELQERQEKLNSLENSLTELENLINKRLAALYKNAKRGTLRLIANSEGLDQLNHMMKYLRVILDVDRKTMKKMAEEQRNYAEELLTVKSQIAAIADLKKSEDRQLSSLKSDLDKKVILLSKIHEEKEFYETAVKELQTAALNLKDTIIRLEKGHQKIKPLPTGFAESRGNLPLPFDGKIVRDANRIGERTFSSQKGIYIRGKFGSEVKAVFPGRVDFSGRLKGYGQVVVINHGSRFFTISAYLLQRTKAEGEMVSKGEVIGQVGETGLLTGPALYFEIRKGEKNLDPLKWLKVH